MLFNSLEFIVFFPMVITSFYFLPNKYRWVLLLFASYYFYISWKFAYIFLILFSTVVDYLVSLWIPKIIGKTGKLTLLCISLSANLGVLFLFKYYNFMVASINSLIYFWRPEIQLSNSDLLLPVGISFYTFQTLSYTIDVYRGKVHPERKFGLFALYVTFFPQLVAGPIERPQNLLPQFKRSFKINYQYAISGFKLMLWGFFKKTVIADRLAYMVNYSYNNPETSNGFELMIATFFFAFQIYCDFSGYTDIARGAARVIGIDLIRNFDSPYFSKSISEFWRRWHISLSTWFRDYVYIPLGGNRKSRNRWYLNLMITFLVSGLWHGANWTFVIWGAIHGCCVILEALWRIKNRFTPYKSIGIVFTFLLVCWSWVFFRANSVSEALMINYKIIESIISFDLAQQGVTFFNGNTYLGQSFNQFGIAGITIIFLLTIEYFQKSVSFHHWIIKRPIIIRWIIYIFFISFILRFGVFTTQEFIYFQF